VGVYYRKPFLKRKGRHGSLRLAIAFHGFSFFEGREIHKRNPVMENEKMYSVKEAALSVLFVSRDSVIRAIQRKELRAWKLRGSSPKRRKRRYECWRIPESELIRYMKRNANY
jgi:excisionase family DNA binding protein